MRRPLQPTRSRARLKNIAALLALALPAAAWGHGGSPRALDFFQDPIGGGELWAVVSTDLGLHVSQDGGQRWYWICEDATSYDLLAFALAGAPTGDPAARAWLAGGVGLSDQGEVIPGLYRSLDGGCNWDPVEGALARHWISALSVDPRDPATVLAATIDKELPNGVAISRDAGLTWAWTSASGLSTPVNSLLRAPSDPQILYASTSRAILRSQDGGLTWTATAADLPQEDSDELWLHAIDPDDPQVAYASLLSRQGRPLYRTRDGGQRWDLLYEPPSLEFSAFAVLRAPGGGRILSLGTAFGDGIRSLDDGQTWEVFFAQVAMHCILPDLERPGGAWVCNNPFALFLPGQSPFAIGYTDDQGERVQPLFAYSQTVDHLPCAPQSAVCEVCARLDNPDVTGNPCEDDADPPPDAAPDLGADAASDPAPPGCDCQIAAPPPRWRRWLAALARRQP